MQTRKSKTAEKNETNLEVKKDYEAAPNNSKAQDEGEDLIENLRRQLGGTKGFEE